MPTSCYGNYMLVCRIAITFVPFSLQRTDWSSTEHLIWRISRNQSSQRQRTGAPSGGCGSAQSFVDSIDSALVVCLFVCWWRSKTVVVSSSLRVSWVGCRLGRFDKGSAFTVVRAAPQSITDTKGRTVYVVNRLANRSKQLSTKVTAQTSDWRSPPKTFRLDPVWLESSWSADHETATNPISFMLLPGTRTTRKVSTKHQDGSGVSSATAEFSDYSIDEI